MRSNSALTPAGTRKPGLSAVSETVQHALQDIGGGLAVDRPGPLAPRAVSADHLAFDRPGREPFVPEGNGNIDLFQQVGRKVTGRLAARPFTAVHVDREADYERPHVFRPDELADLSCVLGKFAPAQGQTRAGHGKVRVRKCQPYRFFPHVQPHQALARGEMEAQVRRLADTHAR